MIQQSEKNRVFCNHTLEHFLDVARLSWIYNLEENSGIDKELIYAAALLHDIGRYQQTADGTPHQQAGAALAEIILPQCGFHRDEISEILFAIRQHRSDPAAQTADRPQEKQTVLSEKLAAYLYRADKQSRCCFACPALDSCNWENEKKNLTIKI